MNACAQGNKARGESNTSLQGHVEKKERARVCALLIHKAKAPGEFIIIMAREVDSREIDREARLETARALRKPRGGAGQKDGHTSTKKPRKDAV
jgi:hypothetical protein